MIPEIAALELEFNSHALPFSRIDLAFGFAVGKARLDGFNQVSEFARNHSE